MATDHARLYPLIDRHAALQAELDARIAAWTADQAIDDLLPKLEAAGLATGRIYRAPDMLEDPHFIARKAIIERFHSREVQAGDADVVEEVGQPLLQ